jgi:acyl-CoA thioester hydrolase
LRSLGVEQDVLMLEKRRIFVVVDTKADFIEPARFNEELLVTAGLGAMMRASFIIEQNIFRNSLDGALLCRGTIRAALLNADTLKPVRVPASLFEGSSS